MRKAVLAVSVALAVAGVAWAGDALFSTSTSGRALTVACSSLTASSGADMSNAIGYNVVVSADRPDAGSQTLIASGTLDCCAYLPVSSGGSGTASTKRWMKCPSSLNVTMSTSCTTGQRDCPSGDFEPLAGIGRIDYVPNTLLVDGGTLVTTTINVRKKP